MASGGASPQAPPTTSRDFVCGDERGGKTGPEERSSHLTWEADYTAIWHSVAD
jgi:hypothetical protein